MKCLVFISSFFLVSSLFAEITLAKGGTHPFRNWEEWTPLNLQAGYFSLTRDTESIQLWFGARFQRRDSLVRLQGSTLTDLNRVPPQFDTRLVKNYKRDLDGIPLPILSRTSAQVLEDGTEVVQGSIGPRYRGGASELAPVLFIRPPNGTWRYLGPPAGDPEDFLTAAVKLNASVRCEGGGLVEVGDGRIRMYGHGIVEQNQVSEHLKGQRVVSGRIPVFEAETIHGPWNFVRDAEGKPVDVLKGSILPWLFPHVQSLGPHGYMLTGADQWPPKAIYAAYSRDGIHFYTPADQEGSPIPLRHMTDVRPKAIFCKTLRGVLDPKTNQFTAAMAVSLPKDRGSSMVYGGAATLDPEALDALITP